MPRIRPGAERLSSALTFPLKVLVPSTFALVSLAFAAAPNAGEPVAIAATAGGLVVAGLFAVAAGRLKKVIATDRGLVVSSLRREILVPWDQISSVRENPYQGSRPITVELRSPTAFGKRFVFMPYASFVVVGDHPAATHIRRRVAAARPPA